MDIRLRVIAILSCLGLWSTLWANPIPETYRELQTDKKHEALNHYVAFNNECIHLMADVRKRLETLNVDVIQYLASDGANPLKFRIHDMVHNFQFKSTLQAPCSWMEGTNEPIVNIQHLYEATKEPSQFIPQSHRVALNTTRNQMLYLMIEFLGLCDTLENYTTNGRFRSEPELRTAFWAMKNCERIYMEFREISINLYDQVNAIADPPPAELVEMRDMIAHSREILRGVRYENPELIQWQVLQLQSLIHSIESHPLRTKRKLQAIGLDSRNSKNGYENMIVHARSLIKMANDYLYAPDFEEDYYAYGKGYYYFNHMLLDVYNHHKYGMLAYYNRFLSFSDYPMVKMVEEPAVYRVIYSLDPVAEQTLPLVAAGPEDPTTTRPGSVSIALYAHQRSTQLEEKRQEEQTTVPGPEESPIMASAEPSVIPEMVPEEKQEDLPNIQQIKDENVNLPSTTSMSFQNQVMLDLPEARMAIATAAANHLIFVIDVSSSMDKPEKLPLLQETLYYLVKMMRPEDHITLIAYSGKAAVVLEATSAAREDYILRELGALKTGGRTNMRQGLKVAYKLAQDHYIPGGNNRVILASDGMIRMNRKTRRLVKRMAWEDISLSTFHLTKGSSPTVKANLENLAKLGAGNYHHITPENARQAVLIEATAVMKR